MTAGIWTDDASMRALKMGLNGLSTRQQVIGRNIANIDTPGYQAQEVNFEDAIRHALDQQQSVSLRVSQPGHLAGGPRQGLGMLVNDRPGGSARTDGNNVDVDVELTEMSEVGIQYQALAQAASKKLLLLKTIATSR